ncbi:hypothetical protein PIB30_065791 [Stylosanthes scabra]|uniref:Calcium-dependent phosphotriesterase superfamily protein n=1 Tax=Stylosanthes scabra TaxID=79078 RepID=A0ABU6YL26_9FABA|nr:hypothetical protein [Stylosanthes scabra]
MALFSLKSLAVLLLLTAIPIGVIVSLERAQPSTHVYNYHGTGGWLRECAKWDPSNRRFIVSFFEGGVGEVRVPEEAEKGVMLQEVTVAMEVSLAGNSSLGISVDAQRNRVLVVHADVLGNRYSALAAYDLSTWQRLFLTQLSGPSDEKSFADDVDVDAEGNAYVTDAKAGKIWKVGVEGNLISIIRNPLFTPKEWYKKLVALNGIVYHPDGFLIVIHTFSGNLFKVDLSKGEEVKVIKVAGGPLYFGDGLALLSPTKLVVAGNPSGRLVESTDGWETASVLAKFSGPMHRLATSATVKDGKPYLSHMIGIGYPKKKFAIVEAVF